MYSIVDFESYQWPVLFSTLAIATLTLKTTKIPLISGFGELAHLLHNMSL